MPEEEKDDQQQKEKTSDEQQKPEATWDKDKQQKDQFEATIKKMSAEREAAEEEKKSLAEQIAEIKAAIVQQQEKSKSDLEPVDDALVDPKVARNLQKLADQIKDLTARHNEQQEKIAQYEKERQQHLQAQQTQQTIEKILKPLDEMYGAKYRTPARELADKMVNDGDADVPADALEAFLLLEKCYKMVKAKDEAAGKTLTPTDSGFGGVPFDTSKVTTGSRDTVLADIRKKGLAGVKMPVGYE